LGDVARIERRRSSCPGGTTPELTRRGSKVVSVLCIMPSATMNKGTASNSRALIPKWASSGSPPSTGRKSPFFQPRQRSAATPEATRMLPAGQFPDPVLGDQSDLALKAKQQVAANQGRPMACPSREGFVIHP
jgi:hypothetical protein